MDKEIKQTIETLLSSPEPNQRRQAAEDLAAGNSLAVVAALAAALRDDNNGVRDAAARSLLQIGGPHVPKAIVEYIADRNITTRNLAGELLIKCGTDAISCLLPYCGDPDEDVRKFAVDILGLVGTQELDSLLIPLINDPAPNVVVSVVEALGNIRSVAAIKPLMSAFERYDYARITVAESLGKIGDAGAMDFLQLKLYWAMQDRSADPLLMFAIIEALGEFGNQTTLELLKTCFERFSGKLRNVALHALVRIVERLDVPIPVKDNWKAYIIAAVRTEHGPLQISAAKALAMFNGIDVTVVFMQLTGMSQELDDLCSSICLSREGAFQAAVIALESLRPENRKQLLLVLRRLVDHAIPEMMRSKGPAIEPEWIGRAAEVVAASWEASDEETRTAIVDVLFRIDGDRAMKSLDEIMRDPDPWLRLHVIETAGQVIDQRGVEFIRRYLADEDTNVQETVVGILQSKGVSIGEMPGIGNTAEYAV
jgi:HEAT repeat protein